jgi:dienelactone hydrolase
MPTVKDIRYLKNSDHQKHTLDVYIPEEAGTFPVLVFIHGGSWYEGSKDIYLLLGEHLAEKGLVTVIINYRLGSEANYLDMAHDCSAAVEWVADAIDWYKGQKHTIYLAGHSAGGHLAALITLNKKFLGEAFITQHIKGCILIDAFGLNMDYVLVNNTAFFARELRKVFTDTPSNWKDAAPVHFIDNTPVPFLIMIGSETYPYLTFDNAVFITQLDKHDIANKHYTLRGKNHRDMVTRMKDGNDEAYSRILEFIQLNSMK